MANAYFTEFYKKIYEILIKNQSIVGMSQSMMAICQSDYNRASRYFDIIVDSKWTESGATVFKGSLTSSIRKNMSTLFNFISNNLVEACKTSINSLLPKLAEMQIQDNNLSVDRAALASARSDLSDKESNMPRMYKDKKGVWQGKLEYYRALNEINRLKEVINGLINDINALIKTLDGIKSAVDGYIMRISALGNENIAIPKFSLPSDLSSDELVLIPVIYDNLSGEMIGENNNFIYSANDENQQLIVAALISKGYISDYNSVTGFHFKDGKIVRKVALPKLYAWIVTDSQGSKTVKIAETDEVGNSSTKFSILKGTTVSLYTILPNDYGRPFLLSRSLTDNNSSKSVSGVTLINGQTIRASKADTWIPLVDFKDSKNNSYEIKKDGTFLWYRTTTDANGVKNTEKIVMNSTTSAENVKAFEEATVTKIPIIETQLTGVSNGKYADLSNTTQCGMTYSFDYKDNEGNIIKTANNAAAQNIIASTGAGGLGGGGMKMMSEFQVEVISDPSQVIENRILLQ